MDKKEKNKEESILKLKEFKRLLILGKSTFNDQIILRNRLYNSFQNHEVFNQGYNQGFSILFDTMDQNQKETFQLIRGITENSISILNQSLSQWITDNPSYKLTNIKTDTISNFNNDMYQLQQHLSLWFSKYNSVFKINSKHCLVYLADERSEGKEFPKTIEKSVDEMIRTLES